MNEVFSQRLKELRQAKNLSQRELAAGTHLQQANISRWEQGQNTPDIDALYIIAKFFCVSADYLLGLENDDGSKNY